MMGPVGPSPGNTPVTLLAPPGPRSATHLQVGSYAQPPAGLARSWQMPCPCELAELPHPQTLTLPVRKTTLVSGS